jgi:hypothetical protein
MSVVSAREPYLTMLLYSAVSRNDLDEGATGPIFAMNWHHVARAKACRASAVYLFVSVEGSYSAQ